MTSSSSNGNDQQASEDSTNSVGSGGTHRILAVYKFVQPKLDPDALPALKKELEDFGRDHFVRGNLLIAPEGINGTIDYPFTTTTKKENNEEEEDVVLQKLQSLFPGLRTRISYSQNGHVFYRYKVKLKSEILTCHSDDEVNPICLDPTQKVGTYVPPGPEWNQLLEDPNCLVVDARNEYEVRIGTFRNAQNPHTETFSELIPWMQDTLEKQQPNKIAMFCTGGIRCEKATSACLDLLLQQKRRQENKTDIPVYHLEGGILAYLDTVPQEQSLFDGDCYVFDQRVAVTHGLEPAPGNYSMCHACRAPLKEQERDGHPDFMVGKQCLYCKNATTEKQQQRFEARQKQIQLAQQKGLLHIHDPKEKVLSVLGGKATSSSTAIENGGHSISS